MNIIKLEIKTDVEDTLKKAVMQFKDCDAVMVLALGRDGQPFIVTSSMTGYQKSWLLAAAQSQLMSLFGFRRNDR
jgi:hypothetical protein